MEMQNYFGTYKVMDKCHRCSSKSNIILLMISVIISCKINGEDRVMLYSYEK